MSKNWNEARQELKEALAKQEEALEHHKKTLAEIKANFAKLDASTPDEVGNIMTEEILRQTLKIQSIERDVRTLQMYLNGKCSRAV